jgi:tRNA pseudouridine55 synthase
MTSHDVVNTLRRLTKERRIGHAGTLDPLATGLLLVCVGPATRLASFLMSGSKVYEARICFGTATTTDDGEGEIIRSCEVSGEVADADFAARYLAELGLPASVLQLPPAYSAIKRDGVTSYKAARAGEALELEPREVELTGARLLECGHDYWCVRLMTSKGFYVRSFARDTGDALGTAAHLGALRRMASGSVRVEQACTLDSLEEGEPLPFIDPVAALGLPVLRIDAVQAERVKNGRALTLVAAEFASLEQGSGAAAENGVVLPPAALQPETVTPAALQPRCLMSVVHEQTLLALYERVGSTGFAHPRVVIPGGVRIGYNTETANKGAGDVRRNL